MAYPDPCEILVIWAKNANFLACLWQAYCIGCSVVNHREKIAPEKGYMDDPDPCEKLAIWAEKSNFSGPPTVGNGTSHQNQWDITSQGPRADPRGSQLGWPKVEDRQCCIHNLGTFMAKVLQGLAEHTGLYSVCIFASHTGEIAVLHHAPSRSGFMKEFLQTAFTPQDCKEATLHVNDWLARATYTILEVDDDSSSLESDESDGEGSRSLSDSDVDSAMEEDAAALNPKKKGKGQRRKEKLKAQAAAASKTGTKRKHARGLEEGRKRARHSSKPSEQSAGEDNDNDNTGDEEPALAPHQVYSAAVQRNRALLVQLDREAQLRAKANRMATGPPQRSGRLSAAETGSEIEDIEIEPAEWLLVLSNDTSSALGTSDHSSPDQSSLSSGASGSEREPESNVFEASPPLPPGPNGEGVPSATSATLSMLWTPATNMTSATPPDTPLPPRALSKGTPTAMLSTTPSTSGSMAPLSWAVVDALMRPVVPPPANISTSAANDSEGIPACPVDAAPWLVKVYPEITDVDLGDSFNAVIQLWMDIEKTQGRKMAKVYDERWWNWWIGVQPSWRVKDVGRPRRFIQAAYPASTDGNWDWMHHPGPNGVLAFVGTLFW
ncbi:hypothetical protein C8R45DRAFT_933115 [Mycena sanguinolenta]|nr:hypothetical protein C8R45DRAFT_933115 [Mycena sanguinolenta]